MPHAVDHSLALLRMDKELPEIYRANLKISELLLLHLVGHQIYLRIKKSVFSLFALALCCYSQIIDSCFPNFSLVSVLGFLSVYKIF